MTDYAFWLALAGALLGGASLILHVVAPRTKNTIDDRLRDDIDEVLVFIRGQQPTPKPPVGLVGPIAMLALVVLGLASSGCATARQAVSAGVVATLECEDGHLDAAMLADAKALASAEVRHWIAGGGPVDTAAIKADLGPIRSDLGQCAIAGALAAAGVLIAAVTQSPAVQGLMADPAPDRGQLRLTVQAAARELGWRPVRVAGGVL